MPCDRSVEFSINFSYVPYSFSFHVKFFQVQLNVVGGSGHFYVPADGSTELAQIALRGNSVQVWL